MTQLTSPPLCAIDAETFAFPHGLLRNCSSALLLFCSGRMGAADGHWVREYGLEEVLCIDWDASTLEPFAAAYPAEWNYLQDDVWEHVWSEQDRWDIVSADMPSQYADRLEGLLLSCRWLARRYIVATLALVGPGDPVVPSAPPGWGYRCPPIYRAQFEDRRFWWVVLEREPTIAFDDGPFSETTPLILDALQEAHERAIFFVTGEHVAGEKGAELLRDIAAHGHAIGNHGWSHRAMDEMPFAEAQEEVTRTHEAIIAACDVVPTRFRPPFRRWPAVTPEPAGYAEVELESSIGDYRMNAAEIIAAAGEVEGTLWLHDGVAATVEALPAILAGRA